MAASVALAQDRHLVSQILHLLSDMKYKDRRQHGPDQPVELLEFRPTLVPCVLVNKLWADEGTSILWGRYPHLPALKIMDLARRQYYANKVHQVFSMGPPPGQPDTWDYLNNLEWPNLKTLELEMDFSRHGPTFLAMLHPGLEHLELSGPQGGGSDHFVSSTLPSLFSKCSNLKSIRFGAGLLPVEDPVHASALFPHLLSLPSITTVETKSAGFMDVDDLFTRLSQRPGLEALEIDLDPGISLLPHFEGPNALPSPFSALKRLDIMCYPDIALAVLPHLHSLEDLQLDVCRIANGQAQDSDYVLLDNLVASLSDHPQLRSLKIGVGALAANLPTFVNLPKLTGSALIRLSTQCPRLEDVYLFAAEPWALDGSDVSAEQFGRFCACLPRLRSLSLKFHPNTAVALEEGALLSLAEHCPLLEVVRLKVACILPSLSVPATVPQIFVDGTSTPRASHLDDAAEASNGVDPHPHEPSTSLLMAESVLPAADSSDFKPLFPCLTHLAIARPESVLSMASDTFTLSSVSHDGSLSDIVDPELEEDLVRAWAQPLLMHFPNLEILEAWGDWMGQDNESLNYFLPIEEVLASTWEFLSGAEQDLWDDDDEEEDKPDSWDEFFGSDDWDKASYVDSFIAPADTYLEVEEESLGAITPGRTLDHDDLVSGTGAKIPFESDGGPIHVADSDYSPPQPPADDLSNLRLS
ncbi:hypothetical protein EJ04DRAFT_513016 [Polyplosphaeria fusca]|uniref:Uncharacterized protein n=1 Tax=Polyplosphaeria fusca TaxID=682080 RepID=A0A9P4QYX8_9PLEO|nr:hypothetical protein EJ04DRAFT_513016 [Polyplosphaeria fusca]